MGYPVVSVWCVNDGACGVFGGECVVCKLSSECMVCELCTCIGGVSACGECM